MSSPDTPERVDGQTLNVYGDQGVFHAAGHGADIASERRDALDESALQWIVRWCQSHPGRHPVIWDMGCGKGVQSLAMAQHGAWVTGIDQYPLPADVRTGKVGGEGRFRFFKGRLENMADAGQALPSAHAFFSQRTLHYLPYSTALRLLRHVKARAYPDACLFVSCSGLLSELGSGYPNAPIASRFFCLSPEMADRHHMHAPVCLYTEAEMDALLTASGWMVTTVRATRFGNIQATASLRRPDCCL